MGATVIRLVDEYDDLDPELTAPGGQIDLPAKWRYWRDKRYSVPRGAARVTPRMALHEQVRRMNEDGFVAQLAEQKVPAEVLTRVLDAAG
jgi:hypothetical protein